MQDDNTNTDTNTEEIPSDSASEVLNAIAAFEKILEAIPNDRISLETLADAYDKIGDRVRARTHMLRLGRVLLDEKDEDAARDLLHKLRAYASNDDEVSNLIAKIEKMEPEKVRPVVLDGPDRLGQHRTANIAAEMSFAWNLLQAKKLTKEEYASVVHDLTENSTKPALITVSTLHVLNDRNFPGINDALAFAANACNTPMIRLANFETPLETATLLPLDFTIRRGAIIFELMGNDALVAVLNPYDEQLAMDIEDLTGKPAYLYLVHPADFDATIEKIKFQQNEAAQAQLT
ncbi:MAG: hypothetical protein ACOYCD_01960 [Kiritimatiellia bacterium]|jgi:hypothetical protein